MAHHCFESNSWIASLRHLQIGPPAEVQMVHLCFLQDPSIFCYPFNVELAHFEIFIDGLRLKQGHCDCAIVGEGHNWLVVCGPVLTRFGTPTKTTDATDIIAEANDHCRFKVED